MKQRWYEQNPDLNEVVNFIQSLDFDDRVVVAKYLLQILISECNINIDEELSKISTHDYSYNRWYDDNFDLSTAFELLKNLSKVEQDFVVSRFLSEIVMSFVKKEL